MTTDTGKTIEKLVNEINDEVLFLPPGPERTQKLKEVVQRRLDGTGSKGERAFYQAMLAQLDRPREVRKTHG